MLNVFLNSWVIDWIVDQIRQPNQSTFHQLNRRLEISSTIIQLFFCVELGSNDLNVWKWYLIQKLPVD